jgi:uncharacterized protein (DUF362 family)
MHELWGLYRIPKIPKIRLGLPVVIELPDLKAHVMLTAELGLEDFSEASQELKTDVDSSWD